MKTIHFSNRWVPDLGIVIKDNGIKSANIEEQMTIKERIFFIIFFILIFSLFVKGICKNRMILLYSVA